MRYLILRLRKAHRGWGPSRIRYHLSQRPSLQGKALPKERQIWRYLHQWPRLQKRRKRQRCPSRRPAAATRVHQRWQVDFKMGIPLSNGPQVNLHTVHDEVGAVCIIARVTPAGQVGQKATRVSLAEVQTTVRAGFIRWGTLPEEVQTDHEAVFVGKADDDFPARFTLWLVGLGITHLTIRPGQPTDNAEVERNHRTLNEYTLVGHEHEALAELQTVLDTACHELAFALPSRAQGCAGQPPVQAHPELLGQPRPFQPHLEFALFDWRRVDRYLAQFTWLRQVGKTGQICIGGHHCYYSVGRRYAQYGVHVRFDPADRHFVFFLDEQPDHEIGRRPAHGLTVAEITGLTPDAPHFVWQQLPLDLVFPEG